MHCLAAREGRGGRVRVLSEDSCLVFYLFCFAEFVVQRQARHICDCRLRFGVDSVAAMLQKVTLKGFFLECSGPGPFFN